MTENVVILSGKRTPIGSFQGALSSVKAPELGAAAIRESLSAAQVRAEEVDEVIMGQVLTGGVGQAPARQASLGGGVPTSVPCLTINKVCGSGLKSVMLGAQSIMLGDSNVVVSGGMESMSNAPYLLPSARSGMRMGNSKALDSMIHDGLWDPYGDQHMGNFGDSCAREKNFSREEQDTFAKESYEYALAAKERGVLSDELVPLTLKTRKGEVIIDADEEPGRYRPEKMDSLRPAFSKEGSVTAANASKINDGAAALVLSSGAYAAGNNKEVLATIVGYATFAGEPSWFTTAPSGAVESLLKKTDLDANDIDLWEINEAFSMVTLNTMRDFGIPREKVNVRGGAVALGHPIGCSGARILVTLIHSLREKKLKRGIATLCIGGGEAVALMVEV